MAKTYTITLTDAEDKALAHVAVSQQDWIENAVKERCRIAIDEIVQAEVATALENGSTISGSKDDIVLASTLPNASARNDASLQSIVQ